MQYIEFEQIVAQLRLDNVQAETERVRLEGMAEAAEEAILAIIRRSLMSVMMEYGTVPARIVQCTLLLIDEWYQHRSVSVSGSLSAVPYAFDFLLKPFMRLTGAEDDEGELPDGVLATNDGLALTDAADRLLTCAT